MNRPASNESAGLRMALDYAPLAAFFLVNFLAPSALVLRLVAGSTGFLSDMERTGALVIARVIVATAAKAPSGQSSSNATVPLPAWKAAGLAGRSASG